MSDCTPTPDVLTEARIIADIASALRIAPGELNRQMDLFDAGLDSVRLMALVDKWRAAGSTAIDFPTLASEPVVGVWIDLITGAGAGAEENHRKDENG